MQKKRLLFLLFKRYCFCSFLWLTCLVACSDKNENQRGFKMGSRLFTVNCFNTPKFPDTIRLPETLFPGHRESYILFHVNYIFDSTGKFIAFDSAVLVMKNKSSYDLERLYKYSENRGIHVTQDEAALFWDWAINTLPEITVIKRMDMKCSGNITNRNMLKIDYYIE